MTEMFTLFGALTAMFVVSCVIGYVVCSIVEGEEK